MLFAKIARSAGSQYKVEVYSMNRHCASATESVGPLRGNVVEARGLCHLTIRFNGRSAHIIERGECRDRGAFCTYSGTLRRER